MLQMVRMIICVCNRINCRSVREAVDAGARSPKAVQAHHGCKFNCGKCSTTIGEMISEKMDAQGSSLPMMAAE
ncbi:MAG: (2Fe-2S)-binding protein [Hyphomonas sp.]|nr:(2Fe-2S)-binding protein [Hyphomonas sp.]